MTDPNLTRASLIFRLKDHADHDAWNQFLDLYGQTIFQFARSRGLQDADAADLMQEVFRRVGNAIGGLEYAKQKGGFRAWLFTITRNCLNSHFKKNQNSIPTMSGSNPQITLGQVLDDKDELTERWEREFEKQIMLQAIEVVKSASDQKTWAAFEMTAIQNLKVDEVSTSLGMSRGAIYVARSRVTSKLRGEVKRLMDQEA